MALSARGRKKWWGGSEWLHFVRGVLGGSTTEDDADPVRVVDAFILKKEVFRMSCSEASCFVPAVTENRGIRANLKLYTAERTGDCSLER